MVQLNVQSNYDTLIRSLCVLSMNNRYLSRKIDSIRVCVCVCSFVWRIWSPGEHQCSQSRRQAAFPSVNNLVPHPAAHL